MYNLGLNLKVARYLYLIFVILLIDIEFISIKRDLVVRSTPIEIHFVPKYVHYCE